MMLHALGRVGDADSERRGRRERPAREVGHDPAEDHSPVGNTVERVEVSGSDLRVLHLRSGQFAVG